VNLIVIGLFAVILVCLAFAVAAFRRNDSDALLKALTLRVSLSVLLFALLLLAWRLGWIAPHGFGQ
jgi:type IV secretory pathway TrbL component